MVCKKIVVLFLLMASILRPVYATAQNRPLPFRRPETVTQLLVNLNAAFERGLIYQPGYFSDEIMLESFGLLHDPTKDGHLKQYNFFDRATSKIMPVRLSIEQSPAPGVGPTVYLLLYVLESEERFAASYVKRNMPFFVGHCEERPTSLGYLDRRSPNDSSQEIVCENSNGYAQNWIGSGFGYDKAVYEIEIGFSRRQ